MWQKKCDLEELSRKSSLKLKLHTATVLIGVWCKEVINRNF